MRKPIVSAVILAGLLAGAASPSLVFGQTAAPNAAVQSPQRTDRQRPLPGQFVEARLANLKTALKIAPAQETQWNALANVMREQAKDMDAKIQQRRAARQAQDQTPPARPSAIERLEQRQQFLADAAARSNALLTAAKPLYASLSPEQKQTADELFARRGHHGHHRGR